jgi:signal peptidase I
VRRTLVVTIVAAAGVVMLRLFVAAPTRVISGSMHPTIRKGEVVLVAFAGAHYVGPGDVIRFRWPDDPETKFVKRVVAVGGQTVRVSSGEITVDGQIPVGPMGGRCPGEELWVGVPEGHLFVLGDARGASRDSRERGAVPVELVDGRAVVILWSYGRTAYGNRLRWDRILRRIT